MHDDPAVAELGKAIRLIIDGQSMESAALTADCSPRTIWRIMHGENATIATASRIARAHGFALRISVEPATK